MSTETPPQEQIVPAERVGSRWLHNTPSEQELRDWFELQPIHEHMEHGPYVGGVVLIGATEKYKIPKLRANGTGYYHEEERQVYVPYVKVDTRISYFWTLVDIFNEHSEETYVGVIEPVPQRVIKDSKSIYYNEHLPDGYFMYPVRETGEDMQRFICAQWSVAIYEKNSYARKLDGAKGELPRLKGIGTKQTKMNARYADVNALMKAETGAIGRALGVAGILVIGTGIATAEDMQEAMAVQAAPAGEGATPVAPPDEPRGAGVVMEGPEVPVGQIPKLPITIADDREPETPQEMDERLREQARDLQSQLKDQYPEAWQQYVDWWKGRQFGALDTLSGPALKGAVVKLERDLDAVKNVQAGPGKTGE